MRWGVVVGAVVVLWLAGCTGSGTPYVWQLPADFPMPAIPVDNAMTMEKVALGRYLFYDTRLSGNQTYACATCHPQANAFSDGKMTNVGSTGQHLARNSMTLGNVAYLPVLTWSNPAVDTLEKQAAIPMFGTAPVELGMTDNVDEILSRFRADSTYANLFPAAFPGSDPYNQANVIKAITSFERTLISGDSPYDRFHRQNDNSAMSDSAQRGETLFFSEKVECYHCHIGLNFTVAEQTAKTTMVEGDLFRNTGLYNLGGTGDYPADNPGIFSTTMNPEDMGAFRIPSLRNIELTAPYMHDGSIATLEDVLATYGRGGRLIGDGPNAGDGALNPHKDPLIRGFQLSDDETADLLAFLKSLTDVGFTTDARFASPF